MANVAQAETAAEQTTGAGAPDTDCPPDLLQQAVRLAALDLIILHTQYGRSYPNAIDSSRRTADTGPPRFVCPSDRNTCRLRPGQRRSPSPQEERKGA
jgi:hypothetical protein